jgi:hypothetical protein
MDPGSLTVVGTGFGGGQITADSADVIASSEKVVYLLPDADADEWIRAANPTSESLGAFYVGRANRLETYLDITEHILSYVRSGLRVCAVFYGHPGVFVFPSHEAIIRAGEEGFAARMLPGISAEDCLFSDLGVDPGRRGCRTFDATDYLIRRRQPDTTVPLILWQVGAVGRTDYPLDDNRANLAILAEVLRSQYGPGHEAVIYEAAAGPHREAAIEYVRLERLSAAPVRLTSTLYVPPRDEPVIDEGMVARLGLPDDVRAKQVDVVSRYRPSRPYAQPKPAQ